MGCAVYISLTKIGNGWVVRCTFSRSSNIWFMLLPTTIWYSTWNPSTSFFRYAADRCCKQLDTRHSNDEQSKKFALFFVFICLVTGLRITQRGVWHVLPDKGTNVFVIFAKVQRENHPVVSAVPFYLWTAVSLSQPLSLSTPITNNEKMYMNHTLLIKNPCQIKQPQSLEIFILLIFFLQCSCFIVK